MSEEKKYNIRSILQITGTNIQRTKMPKQTKNKQDATTKGKKRFDLFHDRDKISKLRWRGKGVNEKAFDENSKCIIECRKKYFRPAEVDTLIGNASKAKKLLKWRPKHNIHSLIKDMISYELEIHKNDK